jgi:hypothetical protein
MSYSRRPPKDRFPLVLRALLACALLFGLVACDSDSPTQPQQTPSPPPGPITATFNVTVTANPNELEAGGLPSTITVTVVNASTGQPVPANTTVVLTTTLGSFGSAGSGQQSGSVELINGTAQVQLFPGDTLGTAVVRAQIQQSSGQATVRIVEPVIEEPDRFFLESISPTSGSPNGGNVLRIEGNGFVEPVRVFVGSRLAEVLNVTPTLIRVRIPAIELPVGQSETVDVSVTIDLNGEGQATDTLPGVFTYTRGGTGGPLQPLVFSVTPNHGPNEGGTQVVIEGDGFEQPVQVLFGSGNAANAFTGIEAQVISVTRTRIVVRTPAATAFGQINLNSQVAVLVRNLSTGSSAIFANAFRYGVDVLITSLGPTEGPYTGGTLVTFFGQGFDEPVAASLAGVAVAQVISVTGTEVIVRASGVDPAGCADVSGASELVNIETGDGATGPTYTYRVVSLGPRVDGVSPSSGAGGSTVTLTGANFIQPLTVVFTTSTSANATILSVPSTNTMTVRVPSFPDTAFEEVDCDDNGDGFTGKRYIATPATITVTNSITTCTDDFEGGFTLAPPSTTCRNDINPNPPAPPAAPVASFTSQTIDAATFTVQFTDTSTNNPTSWSWDFQNDGVPDSNSQFPQFSYPAAGDYPVRLTATNAGGSHSTLVVITVP